MSRALLYSLLVFTLVPPLMAQNRGTGAGGRSAPRTTPNGTRDQIRLHDQTRDRIHDQTRDRIYNQTRDRDRLYDRDQLRDRDRQRDQIHLRTSASSAQKQQYSTARASSGQARNMAKTMRQAAKRGSFNPDQARQQHAQLQEQVRNMQQDHVRLMQGMTTDQATALRARTEEMNRIQERLNNNLQSMHNELQQPSPDRNRVAEYARAMEKDTARWQEQHRNMASTLGLQD